MISKIPQATHEDRLTIAGVALRVYVLDDGRRIIHGDDLAALYRALNRGASVPATDAELLAALVRSRP